MKKVNQWSKSVGLGGLLTEERSGGGWLHDSRRCQCGGERHEGNESRSRSNHIDVDVQEIRPVVIGSEWYNVIIDAETSSKGYHERGSTQEEG